MQLSKVLFSKLKKTFTKSKKQKTFAENNTTILANRDEFIYDDHISLYSFTDENIKFTKMIKLHNQNDIDHIDHIISCYTN